MKVFNIAIIGAGQLGSRHLQGLKLSKLHSNIWVIDNSVESLMVAQQRYEEGGQNLNQVVIYDNSYDSLQQEIDLVIIATSSKPRLSILKDLLSKVKVSYIVLEKFLFTGLADYEEAKKLLDNKGVKAWVNCPRRLFDYYHQIDSIIDKARPTEIQYADVNWGLCCNSIHMIDIFMMLSGQQSYQADFSGVEPTVIESKRNGYIEFNGTIKIQTPNSSTLTLCCMDKVDNKGLIIITNGKNHIVLDESNKVMFIKGKEYPICMKYQSQLTGLVADEILQNGTCQLTTFYESSEYHKVFLTGILDVYNKITGEIHDRCPIT